MDTLNDILRAILLISYVGLFLTAAAILLLVPLALFIFTFMDIFNRDDVGGGMKTLWSLIVLLVPLIGLAIYWLAKPASHQAPPVTESLRRATPVEEPHATPSRAA